MGKLNIPNGCMKDAPSILGQAIGLTQVEVDLLIKLNTNGQVERFPCSSSTLQQKARIKAGRQYYEYMVDVHKSLQQFTDKQQFGVIGAKLGHLNGAYTLELVLEHTTPQPTGPSASNAAASAKQPQQPNRAGSSSNTSTQLPSEPGTASAKPAAAQEQHHTPAHIVQPSCSGRFTEGTAQLLCADELQSAVFTVGRCVGAGRFSQVFEARFPGSGAKLAVKVIKRLDEMDNVLDPVFLANVLAKASAIEQRIGTKLALEEERCPFIAQYKGKASINGRVGMLFEFCDETLESFIASAYMDEALVQKIAHQGASALHHLHTRGIIHRDVNCENMLWDYSSKSIKFIDFGASCEFGEALEERVVSRTFVGTRGYVAPEVVNGDMYGPLSDVWSFGCVLLHLVSRRRPFEKATAAGEGSLGVTARQAQELLGTEYAACVSPALRAFLSYIFQKAEDRPSADKLLRHPYLSAFAEQQHG